MAQKKNIFVTVGTTKFDELLQALDCEIVRNAFIKHNFGTVTVQRGRSQYEFQILNQKTEVGQLDVIVMDLVPSIARQMKVADLIISHCGSGTLLECLQNNKKVCAVVNETLMHNHQEELFDKLMQEQYIIGVKSPQLLAQEIEKLLSQQIVKKYKREIENPIQLLIEQFEK